MERLLCFISARNLGDAVFHAEFLKALVARGFATRYIAWTFPAARLLFADIPGCEIVTSDFPMGATRRSFFRGGFLGFARAAAQLRRQSASATLELVADFRERFAARLTGAARQLSPQWECGHPFRKHNRIGRPVNGPLFVPRERVNLYAAYGDLLRTLTGHGAPAFEIPKDHRHGARPPILGVHPLASARCKLWPDAHWIALLSGLRERYPECRIVLFGAPSDRGRLQALSSSVDPAIALSCGTLVDFRERLADMSMLVGLDSVSVHLANSVGVPSVVLVGPNDPAVFTPPRAMAVWRKSACPFQPCGGKPRCIGTTFQYDCMDAIEPGDVLQAVCAFLSPSDVFGATRAFDERRCVA